MICSIIVISGQYLTKPEPVAVSSPATREKAVGVTPPGAITELFLLSHGQIFTIH